MAKYLWRDEFLIGHEQIDQQHRQLFGLLDQLYDAVCSGQGESVVESIVDELSAYTREHFVTEEALMRELCVPALALHQRDHQRLLDAVQQKLATLRQGGKVVSIELLEFMNQWLGQHILKSDLQLAGYLRDQDKRGTNG